MKKSQNDLGLTAGTVYGKQAPDGLLELVLDLNGIGWTIVEMGPAETERNGEDNTVIRLVRQPQG